MPTSSTPNPEFGQSNPEFTELLPPTGRVIDPLQAVPNEDRENSTGLPWVYCNMVTSLDGATALEGLSGKLGGAGDRRMFRSLRSAADAIIAGSSTVINERYRPAKPNIQGVAPLIVVISGSLNLPIDLPLFQNPAQRPLIATTTSAPQQNRRSLDEVAEVVEFGTDNIDLKSLLQSLGARGIRRALLEGGPTLNGHFVHQDLVDEWNMTLSPLLVAGPSSRSATNPLSSATSPFSLRRLWRHEDTLFGRWTR